MSTNYCIRQRRKGSHLRFEEREMLEAMVRRNFTLPKKEKLSQRKMALLLGVSPATVCRELKRGRVATYDSLWRERDDYSAYVGQHWHDQHAEAKGRSLAIGRNYELAQCIEELILENYSPYCVIAMLADSEIYKKTPICVRTLYNYIEAELFLKITKKDLPRKGKGSRRGYKKVTRRPRIVGARSIDQRPKEAEDRSEVGHFEMDCIESGKGKSGAVLLNLTDRMSRSIVLKKMPKQTSEYVVAYLDEIERRIGQEAFRKTIKTITVDNGSEFMDLEGMERSVMGKGKRTKVYYCHPYRPHERGTNEQTNGLIRYFIPKGADINDYSDEQIHFIEERLNTQPRKIFHGKSAQQIWERNDKTHVPSLSAALACT